MNHLLKLNHLINESNSLNQILNQITNDNSFGSFSALEYVTVTRTKHLYYIQYIYMNSTHNLTYAIIIQ